MTTKIVAMAGILLLASCKPDTEAQTNTEVMKQNKGKTEFLNPETLSKNPAFSQVAVVTGSNRTVYIGGQDAIDREGKIVGKGNLEQQAQQVLTNIEAALKASGAGFEHIVKWNIYFVKGQDPRVALKVFQAKMSGLKSQPLVTGVFVESLASPDYLLEIEAIAVVPE